MTGFSASGLIREARRRRVFRTIGLYIVGAWVVVQIALAVFPAIAVSEEAIRYIWIAALLGFPIAIAFGWRFDIRGGHIVRTGPAGDDVPLSLQRTDFMILGALGLVALAILIGSAREIGEMEPEQSPAIVQGDIDPASVAVLPFANMSADPNNEYFSDGLTETLLHMLAQLEDLKVAARTSSFAFKGENQDIRNIAFTLGVAHVLEGSVQKAGDQIRVTAQLIRADDGFHVWSQNYDRLLEDVFAIQDEIATDVASALGSSLLGAGDTGIQGISTEDFSAYDLFLQALEQQNINTLESLPEAERLFLAAIEKDPDFIDAKVALARNFIFKRFKEIDDDSGNFVTAEELIADIRRERPDNVSAHLMELYVQFLTTREESGKWGPNETNAQIVTQMLELALNNRIDSFATRVVVSLSSGFPYHRDEEALTLLSAALEADPLNFDLLWTQGTVLWSQRKAEEARQPLLTAYELAPQNPDLAITLAYLESYLENYVKAFEWFYLATKLDPGDTIILTQIAKTYYDLGMQEEGDYWLDQMRTKGAEQCLIDGLEVISAELSDDHTRIIESAKRDLEKLAADEQICYFPVDHYVWTMYEEDRAQEALDYLHSLVPEIKDYSTVIVDNRRHYYIQAMSVNLQSQVMEASAFQEMYKVHSEAMAEAYPNMLDIANVVYVVSNYELAGERELARQAWLENYETMMGPQFWERFFKFPWLESFRKDPEVAATIAQHLRKMETQKQAVAEMSWETDR